ncbi:MAG: hypothetical protein ACFFDT_04690 [Candidatus Hodarchaeota archaeon]
MIFAAWILNKKGLVYYSREYTTLDSIIDKNKQNELLLHIFLQGQNIGLENEDNMNHLSKHEIKEFYGDLSRNVSWLVFKGETFVILTSSELDEASLESHFSTLKEISASRLDIIGMVIAIHDDDLGPKVVENQSSLTESELLSLSIQGATIVGMGAQLTEGLHGPIPVPSREDLQTLIFSFHLPAPKSIDSRIREFGRPGFVFLLFSKNYPYLHSKNVHLLLEAYLERAKDVELKESRFDVLFNNILNTLSLAVDITKIQSMDLKRLKEEIRRLREENQRLIDINRQIQEMKKI